MLFLSRINRNLGNIVMCIMEIITGVLLLIDPIGFTTGIIILLGILLTAAGIKNIVRYFRTEPETARQENSLVKGLLFTSGGLFCILETDWFFAAFPLLTVLYGILIFVSGVNKLQWAIDMFRMKQKYWFVALLGAILSLLFALIVLINPLASTAALWMFVAVSLLVEAVFDVITLVINKGRKDNAE